MKLIGYVAESIDPKSGLVCEYTDVMLTRRKALRYFHKHKTWLSRNTKIRTIKVFQAVCLVTE